MELNDYNVSICEFIYLNCIQWFHSACIIFALLMSLHIYLSDTCKGLAYGLSECLRFFNKNCNPDLFNLGKPSFTAESIGKTIFFYCTASEIRHFLIKLFILLHITLLYIIFFFQHLPRDQHYWNFWITGAQTPRM